MARQSKEQAWGYGLGALVLIAVISQCSGTKEKGGPEVPTALPVASTAPSSIMYVTSASLNCRASPDPSAEVVQKLPLASLVAVGRSEGGWVEAVGAGKNCWLAQRFLSDDQPDTVAQEVPEPDRVPIAAPPSYSLPASDAGGRECQGKRVCREMDSCKEAYFYLNQCGVGRLDRDGDGVPCESICGH